nr:Chain C, Non-structural protein 7 [Severe acute respiratory syndrome coronavirus 2]
KLWAQCVQL